MRFTAFFYLPLLLPTIMAKPRVLIYSLTREFRHESIPSAIKALQAKAIAINVEFDNSEDPARFTDEGLSRYDAIIFLSNTAEVLDEPGKLALQNYFDHGGNLVGIHSASDCLRTTPNFIKQLGAKFDFHADLQPFTVNVVDSTHPSTSPLPARWEIEDEIYYFQSDPRANGAVVVLAADPTTFKVTKSPQFDQESPHPLAWYQEHASGVTAGRTAGRSFYTSLGHLTETWQNETFMGHVLGGITWVLAANTTKAFNPGALVGNGDTPTTLQTSTSSDTSGASTTSNTDSVKTQFPPTPSSGTTSSAEHATPKQVRAMAAVLGTLLAKEYL